MTRRKNNDEQTTEDVLAAAVEANFKTYEKKTGNPREVMLAQMSDEDRYAAEQAQAHHAGRMRAKDRPGW